MTRCCDWARMMNTRPGTQIQDADRLMYWSEQTGGLIGDRSGVRNCSRRCRVSCDSVAAAWSRISAADVLVSSRLPPQVGAAITSHELL